MSNDHHQSHTRTKKHNQPQEPAEMTDTASDQETGQDLNLEDALKAELQDGVKKLETEIAQEKDKLIRLFAEFENYKKRTVRERMDLIKNAGHEVISSLLPVLDDFERALKNIGDTEREGLQLVYQKFKSLLEQKGLTAMETIGNPFDTDLHDAVTSVPAPENMKGKVIDEAEKGYFLNGKVIRHAKVIVGE